MSSHIDPRAPSYIIGILVDGWCHKSQCLDEYPVYIAQATLQPSDPRLATSVLLWISDSIIHGDQADHSVLDDPPLEVEANDDPSLLDIDLAVDWSTDRNEEYLLNKNGDALPGGSPWSCEAPFSFEDSIAVQLSSETAVTSVHGGDTSSIQSPSICDGGTLPHDDKDDLTIDDGNSSPNGLRAPPPTPAIESMSLSSNPDPKDTPTDVDVLRKASQADVVQKLTTSNRETFECLKVFCEKYKERKGLKLTHRQDKKIYKRIAEQAGIYVGTIDTSLRIAQKGIAISRDAIAGLTYSINPETLVNTMLATTKAALTDINTVSSQFRGIRVVLYEQMQAAGLNSMPQANNTNTTQVSKIDAKALRSMDQNDLLLITLAVLDRFVSIVSDFINWWNSMQVDVDRLRSSISYIHTNPAISGEVQRHWSLMEEHYRTYHSEIMAQQDFYDHTLKDLMPKSIIHRFAHKLGFE